MLELAFLSGGTGTPKLIQGMLEHIAAETISIICNTGDDYSWHGLHVSPDLDTVLYLLSGKLDLSKFWGVVDESFNSLRTIKSLGVDEWFNVGDKDLGLHVWRTNRLLKNSLTELTKIICEKWKITSKVMPMADSLVQTKLLSKGISYNFQEYFVKHRTNIDVETVTFDGDKSQSTLEVRTALHQSRNIIIGPSNPITSIGPILSIDDIIGWMKRDVKKTIAISPIIGTKAFSGPTSKLMRSMGIKPDPTGLASYYEGIISKLILDPRDRKYEKQIQDHQIEPIFLNIAMDSWEQKKDLAKQIIDLL